MHPVGQRIPKHDRQRAQAGHEHGRPYLISIAGHGAQGKEQLVGQVGENIPCAQH